MKTLKTEIEIAASADYIWSVLMDFVAYPRWNPFITEITGRAVSGKRLYVTITPPGGKAMVVKPKVLTCDVNKQLVWKGSLFLPGIFDGEHTFEIMQHDGFCVFVQKETFGGLLLPVFERWMLEGTREGFKAMNQALKAEAEFRFQQSVCA